MQMTRSRKILGTAEVVAAVVVLVLAVVLAPAYTGEQPAETAPATEATEAATADAETQPTETTTEPPTEPPEVGEYTVENYIVLTSDSAMEMYSVAKKRLTEYGETLNALKSRVPEINVMGAGVGTLVCYFFLTFFGLAALGKETNLPIPLFRLFGKPFIFCANTLSSSILITNSDYFIQSGSCFL